MRIKLQVFARLKESIPARKVKACNHSACIYLSRIFIVFVYCNVYSFVFLHPCTFHDVQNGFQGKGTFNGYYCKSCSEPII